MPRVTQELPQVTNVAAGSKATINIPIGRTIDKVVLEYTNATRAQLEDITVRVNGKPMQYFADGDMLDLINDYYGRSDTAGFLTLYFNRMEMTELGQQRMTGLGTMDVQTVSIDVKVNAAAAGVTLKAHAQTSDNQPFGAFVKVKEFISAAGPIGQFEIDNIPRGPKILCMHLNKADVDKVEVEVESFKWVDAEKTLLEVLQKEEGRTPQTATTTHVDFGLEGDIFQALSTTKEDGKTPVSDFRLRLTLGSAGSVTTVVEYVDGYAGI